MALQANYILAQQWSVRLTVRYTRALIRGYEITV